MKKYSDLKFLSDLIEKSSIQNVFITWLNHSSLIAHKRSFEVLHEFDYIGIDGTFLQVVSGYQGTRSSADLLLPPLLSSRKFKVILVGGKPETLLNRRMVFESKFPLSYVCDFIDGYSEEILHRILRSIEKHSPDLIIIGMGAPRQELLCLNLKASLSKKQGLAVVTCGGWLDQIAYKNYYPKWAYPLKLNWLVRLVREPRRLWRRYTLEPIILFFNLNLVLKLKQLLSKA
jgi:exopolysaccharide biosynthesis WecB/TagA/CpsF family protein